MQEFPENLFVLSFQGQTSGPGILQCLACENKKSYEHHSWKTNKPPFHTNQGVKACRNHKRQKNRNVNTFLSKLEWSKTNKGIHAKLFKRTIRKTYPLSELNG